MPQPIHVVVGARPNQMKAAPLLRALREHPDFDPILVDTGQHYDHEMAGIFMQQFGMGKPDFALEVGSGTHGAQTAKILERYEALLLENSSCSLRRDWGHQQHGRMCSRCCKIGNTGCSSRGGLEKLGPRHA